MIELQHLTKRFATKGGTVVALNDINLTIRDGDIYGIIGMSGAGKSTLVRCINMLERPDEGSVVVDGRQFHSFGISIERCAEIMESYNAYQASMLDGGSSSVMVYQGREITSPTTLSQNPEGRYLPDAFLIR